MATDVDKLIAKAQQRAAMFGGILMILLAIRAGRRVEFDREKLLFKVDGRTVSVAEVRKQLDLLEGKVAKTMDAYANKLESKEWTLSQWRDEMESLIRDSHMLFGALALGSLALAANNGIVLARTARDLSYLDHKFTPAIKAKKIPTLLALKRRAKSYIRSMAITYAQVNHQLHILMGFQEAKRILRAHESCRDLGYFPPPFITPDEELAKKLPPLPESVTLDGITVKLNPIKGMSPEHERIQQRTLRELVTNPQALVDRYYNEIKDDDGNVVGRKMINADEAKTLFPEYNADRLANVSAVHEASSAIAKLAFAQRSKQLKSELPDRPAKVLFMAGGAAAGKTRAAKIKINEADLIFDGTFKSPKNNEAMINQVINDGHVPSIAYVFRDVKEAAKANVKRSIKHGRAVPIYAAADGHFGAAQTMINHTYEYATSRGIQVDLINNVQGKEPENISLHKLKGLVYNKLEDVVNTFREASYAEYERNKEKYDPRLPDALEGRAVGPAESRDGGIPGQPVPQADAGANKGVTGRGPPGGRADQQGIRSQVVSDKTLQEKPFQIPLTPRGVPIRIRGCWSYRNIWLPIREQPSIGSLRCSQFCKCFLIYR